MIVEWNDPEDTFDPDQIDIGPAIHEHLVEQRRKQTDEAMARYARQVRAGERQGQEMRQRWIEAKKAGLIGDFGVLYVPSKYKLAYDRAPNEFGKAQTTPPDSGWYVILKREKNDSGRVEAAVTAAGSGAENPAAAKADDDPTKRRTQLVR